MLITLQESNTLVKALRLNNWKLVKYHNNHEIWERKGSPYERLHIKETPETWEAFMEQSPFFSFDSGLSQHFWKLLDRVADRTYLTNNN